MKRSIIYPAGIVGILTVFAQPGSTQNVVLILCDDLSPHWTVYGTPAVKTFTAELLASQGMLFRNAFSTCASCSPSRSSILTGMYPHSNGHWRNTLTPSINDPESEFSRNPEKKYDHVGIREDLSTLPGLLNEKGYFTVITHKLHLSPVWKFPFQQRANCKPVFNEYREKQLELRKVLNEWMNNTNDNILKVMRL